MCGQGGSEQQHAYLILSRRDSSMVLQTGQEINELDSSGFATAQTTVFAGNLGGESTLFSLLHCGSGPNPEVFLPVLRIRIRYPMLF
jgi:cleavage and polyadenylation specificity factor subunit 1